jgi:hypothetical protein
VEQEQAAVGRVIDRMSDRDFAAEWFGFFGVGRGAQLFGWILLVRLSGVSSFRDLERANVEGLPMRLPRTSLFRVWQDLGRFRKYLAAREGGSVEVDDLVERARRIAGTGVAPS